MRRSPNFYNAVRTGLEIADRTFDLENISLEITGPKTSVKSLEENYNIAPLRNSQYLRTQRGISLKTLNGRLFKGRILNAYHVRDNGGKIANIAFPKYDLEGHPKNYILYNKPYRSKKDDKIRKFRLVLNQKDHFLFYSKPLERPARIIFGESGIDLLSYHELHGRPDNFYISFGGNVYNEKLQFFIQLIEPLMQGTGAKLVSIMDNDLNGHEFDIKVFAAVINQYNPNIYIETAFRSGNVTMSIHYIEKIRGLLPHHATILEERLTSYTRKDDLVSEVAKCVGFSDKILLEFTLRETISTAHTEQKKNMFEILLGTVNGLYLPLETNLHKSQGKDWNDDLRATKEIKFVKMEGVTYQNIAVGDKIELNTAKGPEGTTNNGIVKVINNNGVECDFGLQYTYAIPYSAIKAHLRKNAGQVIEQDNEKSKMNSKNNNLQNNLS